MAKIRHHDLIDTIDDIISSAEKKGLVHLNSDDDAIGGRIIRLNGKDLTFFGSCGYLGLEQDPRLKKAVSEYVERYGTQFSVSRTYVSTKPNVEIEELLQQMYQKPVIVYPSTSNAHISIIPTLIGADDAVILDQQVHFSVQTAVQLLRQKGTHIEMIRHSKLDMLEDRIKKMGNKYRKIWYMIDGIYSMYGDTAPINRLNEMLNEHENLHLYVDDAHGMSWFGKNGSGYVFNQVGVPEKMLLVTTLAKGFGVNGGIAVFPNEELCRKVKVFGGPLTYSHPIAPPILGAAIASAKIHLSDEIYDLQDELAVKILHTDNLLRQTDLPLMSDKMTPIFFIGMGMPKMGYNMVKRVLNEGLYTNLAVFPAVPVKSTGIRFTITRHSELQDIDALVQAIDYHYPKALEEEQQHANTVRKLFALDLLPNEKEQKKKAPQGVHHSNEGNPNKAQQGIKVALHSDGFNIQSEKSIDNIDAETWDLMFKGKGIYDYKGMKFLEDVFGDETAKPEDHWDFTYIIIRDSKGAPVLGTFLTTTMSKDDMLSPATVSMQIESIRESQPYHLASKTIFMGSLFTEGDHLWLDRDNPEWKRIMGLFLEKLYEVQEQEGVSMINLRDFNEDDIEMRDFLMDQGFFTVNMPETNQIDDMSWNTNDEFLESISKRSRRHMKYDVLKNEHLFEIEIKEKVTKEEAAHLYQLYLNVKANNYDINIFAYPQKIIEKMSEHDIWEYVLIKLKSGPGVTEEQPIGVFFGYKNELNYCPEIVGINYEYLHSHKIYKQAIFQMVKRARQLGIPKIHLGFSASIEKKKVGARQLPKVAFVQAMDNYNLEVIGMMNASERVNV